MTIEEPVGVSKFDHAFIQANFVAHPKEMMVGEKLRLEFQLVNLGKNSAFLTEIDGIVPEGFALIEKPEKCAVDDGAINLKGGKLAALETKELVLTLKSKKKGVFTFTPNIRYMDECGEHRYCRTDDLSIAVKELGIRGWLKGAS
jgi:hypothetical protein